MNDVLSKISSIKNLHIVQNDKFTDDYILFITDNFSDRNNFFLVVGTNNNSKNEKFSLNNIKNTYHIKSFKKVKNIIFIEKLLYKSRKIHLNGLFNNHLLIILFFQFWLLKKSNWIVWGGDLYDNKEVNKTLKSRVRELIKSFVIKRLSEITATIEGDYKVAKNIYKTEAEFNQIEGFTKDKYSDYIETLNNNIDDKNINKSTTIQIGNSSDPQNRHLDIFEKIAEFKNKDIKIIVPLSYGDNKYRKKVIESGNEFFGDKFKPLLDFYPQKEYIKILSEVDIGIFNHKRQQGLGNINLLLRLGKKVYIRRDISSWSYYNNREIFVYDTIEFFKQTYKEFIDFDLTKSKSNIKKMRKIRSKDEKINYWDKIII